VQRLQWAFVKSDPRKFRTVENARERQVAGAFKFVEMAFGNDSPEIFRFQMIKIPVVYKQTEYFISFFERYFYIVDLSGSGIREKLLNLLDGHILSLISLRWRR
jgi:hypothetical protein